MYDTDSVLLTDGGSALETYFWRDCETPVHHLKYAQHILEQNKSDICPSEQARVATAGG